MSAAACGCEKHHEHFVAYVQGELAALPRAHLESHLAHCGRCAQAVEKVSTSLLAARCFQPQIDAASLERMNGRLQPYVEKGPPRWMGGRSLLWAGALAAAGFAWALLVMWHGSPQAVSPTPAAQISHNPMDFGSGWSWEKASRAWLRTEVTPHVKFVAPDVWQGRIERHEQDVTFELWEGFVAVSVEGGNGRRVAVQTPNCRVEVVGTRFGVVVLQEERALVHVAEGVVAVWAGEQRHMVRAGESAIFDDNGRVFEGDTQASAAGLETALNDAFLLSPPASAAAGARRKAIWRRKPPAAPAAGNDVFARMQRAEELQLRGELQGAVKMYQAIAQERGREYEPVRGVAAYEAARIVGFDLGHKRRATDMLQRLAAWGDGEVMRQAHLALCELQLDVPCAAKECLLSLVQHEGREDRRLHHEASVLAERWKLSSMKCGSAFDRLGQRGEAQ